MKYPNLMEVDKVYSYAAAAQSVLEETVPHPQLKQICERYLRLRKELGPDNTEIFWKSSLATLYGYIKTHLAAPLPFNRQQSLKLVDEFKNLTSNAHLTVPSYANQIDDLKNILIHLKYQDSNPLYEKFEEVAKRENFEAKVGLVVPSSNLQESREFFNNQPFFRHQQYGKFTFVHPKDLREISFYETIIVFGWTTFWRRQGLQYIFDAPRANRLFLISYDWIPNDLERIVSFVVPQGNTYGAQFTTMKTSTSPVQDFNELLPTFSLDELRDRIAKDNDGEVFDDDDLAMVNLVELADSKAVFINRYSLSNPAKTTKHLTISLSGSEKHLRDQLLDEIEPGDFLVLRTEGGGVDYIVPIADSIMASDAAKCRETQKMWKRILREEVNTKGINQVVNELQDIECNSANSTNVKNWINPRSIMLQSESDFRILMSFLNLGGSIDDILLSSRLINKAHITAGRYIRNTLLSQIKNISMEELSYSTVKEFTLDEYGAGSMTAFQILNVGTKETELHVSKIGKIFTMD